MSAPELLFGGRAAASVPLAAEPLDLSPQDTLHVPDAEVCYSLFEIPMAAALTRLPRSLHPSVPAIMGITFIHATAGPLGAFDLAYVGIACRTGIKPRHFITGAFCQGEAAAAFFRARYGFPCVAAEVGCRESHDRIRGHVTLGGRAILDLTVTSCVPLIGAGLTIKYSPPLNATRVADAPALVQFEAAYTFKRAQRGRPQAVVYDAARLGDAAVAPVFPIAGSHAVCDLELLPVRFQVDLEVPAENGGARRIAR
jgi:hypothetical protein